LYDGPVQDLIDELGRLPGIGPKSAQRIAFWMLDQPAEDVGRLAEALLQLKQKVHFCSVCFNVTDQEVCRICRDPRRDAGAICVVEESKDVVAIERTREFRGRYHVLGGAISPIAGRGPGDLHIAELVRRLADDTITEVILATNPRIEGDLTFLTVVEAIRRPGLRISRLAYGLPVGGSIGFADRVTLHVALESRKEIETGG